MPVIFLSYRRTDSQDATGRIYDRLTAKFTQKQVFKDVDSIPLGASFSAHIRHLLGKANVVLVVIGPSWLTATDDHGQRRLENPNDYVRLEIEIALQARMLVIPVLVSNARMPLEGELPASIKELASRHGMAIRPDPDFNNDIARLFSGLEQLEELLDAQKKSPVITSEIGTKGQSTRLPDQLPETPSRTFGIRRRVLLAVCLGSMFLLSTGWFYKDALSEEIGWWQRWINRDNDRDVNKVQDSLDGSWLVESAQNNKTPRLDVGSRISQQFNFADSKLDICDYNGKPLEHSTFTFDASNDPKWIDINKKPIFIKGIYKFEAEKLVLCIGVGPEKHNGVTPLVIERPSNFDSTGAEMLVLRRKKQDEWLKISELKDIKVKKGAKVDVKVNITFGKDVGQVALKVQDEPDFKPFTDEFKENGIIAAISPNILDKPGEVTVTVTGMFDYSNGNTYTLKLTASANNVLRASSQCKVVLEKK